MCQEAAERASGAYTAADAALESGHAAAEDTAPELRVWQDQVLAEMLSLPLCAAEAALRALASTPGAHADATPRIV